MDIPSIIVDILMGALGFMIGVASPASSILLYMLMRDTNSVNDAQILAIYVTTAIIGAYLHEASLFGKITDETNKILSEIHRRYSEIERLILSLIKEIEDALNTL